MSDVYVMYVGPKRQMVVPFPMPLRSLSEMEGQIEFPKKQAVKVSSSQAQVILKVAPDTFKEVVQVNGKWVDKKEAKSGEGSEDSI
jgi:hypothetical protein